MEEPKPITVTLSSEHWKHIVWLSRQTLHREMMSYTLGGHNIVCIAEMSGACNALAAALPYDEARGFGVRSSLGALLKPNVETSVKSEEPDGHVNPTEEGR